MTDRIPAAGPLALTLDPHWLASVLPSSLAFVGPRREIEVELDDPRAPGRALDALTPALDRDALADATGGSVSEVEELVDGLVAAGALRPPSSEDAGPPGVLPLVRALLRGLERQPLTAEGRVVIATADELLVLPPGMTPQQERRALHAFVGGMTPDLRLRAYARVAAEGVAVVRGDQP